MDLVIEFFSSQSRALMCLGFAPTFYCRISSIGVVSLHLVVLDGVHVKNKYASFYLIPNESVQAMFESDSGFISFSFELSIQVLISNKSLSFSDPVPPPRMIHLFLI